MDAFLGTSPNGDMMRSGIGCDWKGPAIRPNLSSFLIFCDTAKGFCRADLWFGYGDVKVFSMDEGMRKPIEKH